MAVCAEANFLALRGLLCKWAEQTPLARKRCRCWQSKPGHRLVLTWEELRALGMTASAVFLRSHE